MARIVIAGGGVAGLSTALLTATAGHTVTVLEAQPSPGGKLGEFARDGFRFDTGPSVFTLPDIYRRLFARAGLDFDELLDLRRVAPSYDYWFADGTRLTLPAGGIADVVSAMDDVLGGGAGAQWRALLERGKSMWDVTHASFLEAPLEGPRTLLKLSRRVADVRTVAPHRTMRSLAYDIVSDPRLRCMVDRYATYTGSDPRQAPAALLTIPYTEQATGSWYVPGGLRRLAEVLTDAAEKVGVDIRCDTRVDTVHCSGGAVTGVTVCGAGRTPQAIGADVVVSCVDTAQLVGTMLPGGPTSRLARRVAPRLASATPSLSGFVLLLALRGRTPGLAHHTVSFPADYDDEFDAVFGAGRRKGCPRPVPDPVIYVSAPDDPATRPDDDHEAWFVLVNAPRHTPADRSQGVDWLAEDSAGVTLSERYAQHVLDVMERRGFHVKDRVLWHETISPADLEQRTGSVGGSIYGSSSNGGRSAFLRPSNATAIKGLYLAGGSAHPGGGLPLVGLSAMIVADLIGEA